MSVIQTFDITFYDPILKNNIKENLSETIIEQNINTSFNELKKIIPRMFRKCCFSLEKTSENSIIHWQMRMRTMKNYTLKSFIKHINDETSTILSNNCKILPTCETNINNFNYCVKLDESKIGNHSYIFEKNTFSLLNDETNEKEKLNEFIPLKYSHTYIKHLKHFQKEIIKIAKNETNINDYTLWNNRSINYIYHPLGGGGKSTLAGLLKFNFKTYGLNAIKLPCINDYKILLQDLYQQANLIGKRDDYIVIMDFPRALNKERLYQIYSALEESKDGLFYDPRYDRKEFFINCPSVWIFSNQPPDVECLSLDRWNFYEIKESNELIPNTITPNTITPNTITKDLILNKLTYDELLEIKTNYEIDCFLDAYKTKRNHILVIIKSIINKNCNEDTIKFIFKKNNIDFNIEHFKKNEYFMMNTLENLQNIINFYNFVEEDYIIKLYNIFNIEYPSINPISDLDK